MKTLRACMTAAPAIPPGCGGVYVLMCGGWVYPGQTVRQFAKRWAEHLDELRSGTHPNDRLRAAWALSGDMTAAPLWIGPKDATDAWERWYIDQLRRAGYAVANEV